MEICVIHRTQKTISFFINKPNYLFVFGGQMTIRVAINGFGRIGRAVLRSCINDSEN